MSDGAALTLGKVLIAFLGSLFGLASAFFLAHNARWIAAQKKREEIRSFLDLLGFDIGMRLDVCPEVTPIENGSELGGFEQMMKRLKSQRYMDGNGFLDGLRPTVNMAETFPHLMLSLSSDLAGRIMKHYASAHKQIDEICAHDEEKRPDIALVSWNQFRSELLELKVAVGSEKARFASQTWLAWTLGQLGRREGR